MYSSDKRTLLWLVGAPVYEETAVQNTGASPCVHPEISIGTWLKFNVSPPTCEKCPATALTDSCAIWGPI